MSIYDTLNKEQKEAVFCTEGPLLILAGAGSGKTRVLTHRIAYMIDEKGVAPWNILAITFTKKAASEMRDRVNSLLGAGGESVWVSTFHSMCSRILRRYISLLGYDTSFVIYDTDDQKTLIKNILKRKEIDSKVFKERMFMSRISKAKNEMIGPEEYLKLNGDDFAEKKVGEVYKEYQKELKKNNAVDYDDLLLLTVKLFKEYPEVLNQYQERFRYILIDEYQDTNMVQFELVALLADKYRNLCVVGDDDQSIYRFRGADIKNILNFEKIFRDTRVIYLEQNYRSTQSILNAANEVIKNNKGRKEKRLWCENGEGDPVKFRVFETGYAEADFVARDIASNLRYRRASLSDHAILYRTNAQSRLFEEKLIQEGIAYKIVGGINFYGRKEIKDLLAYMRTVENGADDVSCQRIINVPRRGIGNTAVARLSAYAAENEISFYDAVLQSGIVPGIDRSRKKIMGFAAMMEGIREKAANYLPSETLKLIIEETGYVRELEAESTQEAESKIENIDEFLSKVLQYEESAGEEATLAGFLEDVALVADVDSLEENSDYVVLMTLHSAKGLEFPIVYMPGMEEGLFPGYRSIVSDDPTEIEEERRLCYVGITRARKSLTLSGAKCRTMNGQTQYNPVSRFIKEIPINQLDTEGGSESLLIPKKTDNMPRNTAFKEARSTFRSKPFGGGKTSPDKAFAGIRKGYQAASKPESLDYEAGDRVSHIKFGEGTVESIKDQGRDFEVTVNFDKAGVKKMFAAFAKLKKI